MHLSECNDTHHYKYSTKTVNPEPIPYAVHTRLGALPLRRNGKKQNRKMMSNALQDSRAVDAARAVQRHDGGHCWFQARGACVRHDAPQQPGPQAWDPQIIDTRTLEVYKDTSSQSTTNSFRKWQGDALLLVSVSPVNFWTVTAYNAWDHLCKPLLVVCRHTGFAAVECLIPLQAVPDEFAGFLGCNNACVHAGIMRM